MTWIGILILSLFIISVCMTFFFIFRTVKLDNLQTAKEDTERNMDVPVIKAELSKFIREYDLDNEFDTPAFILTEYIWNCLIASKTK